MQVQKGFQCSACNTFLSHPIDSCPVCSDQFYWMVVTASPASAAQRGAFVAAMINLVEGAVTEEFLTHGEQLWLPYRFWAKDASGTSLTEFGWIDDLELFQHNPNRAPAAAVEVAAQSEPKPWETIPKMALPDFSGTTPARGSAPAAPLKQAPTHAPKPAPPEPEPKGKLFGRKKAKKKEKPALEEGRRFIPKQLFIPAMIFFFFLLLSLSYLVMRYHKNHMAPKAPSQSLLEESHEWPLLS